MDFESTFNEGTTFFLYLGTNDGDDHSEPTKKKEVFSPNTAKMDKTILVLDDSNIHNLATKEFLSYSFSECLTATTKKQAYKILEENSIDCFVMDYIINDTDSIEIANYIRKRKNIPTPQLSFILARF